MGWFKDFFTTEEEEPEVEKYEIDVFCMNCKNKSEVKIIKGKSVKDNLRKVNCSNCGLNEFVSYSFNICHKEGQPIQIESLIDWINVDDEFKKKYIATKKSN